MRRKFVRWIAASFLVVLGAAFPAVGFAVASQAQPQTAQQSAAQGLSTLDREFLVVINFANLWEVPMGDLAAERGTTQKVRDVGAEIAQKHGTGGSGEMTPEIEDAHPGERHELGVGHQLFSSRLVS